MKTHPFSIRLLFSLLFLIPLTSAAPQTGGPGPSSSASKVSVTSKLSVDKVTAGTVFKAAVQLTMQEGWHVNSNTPSEDYLIGTVLELQPREGIILTDLRYPEGKDLTFAFAEKPLNVYEGTVSIFLSLKLSENYKTGPDTLRARLRIQACNDQVCLAPSTLDVAIPFDVVPSGTPTKGSNEDIFSSYTVQEFGSGAATESEISRMFEAKGSFLTFAAIFLVGLALNLTPCVYPMMSVTVSIFGAQTETDSLRVFSKAVVYVLGIASMYSVLGVGAALGGGLFGSWLQSPWVLGGIGALLFALALSSFGLYQIQVPYWLTSKLGGTTGTGLISLYLSGLVVGVFAAPCIGPPVIALLAFVGAKGDPFFGFWTFFILSLGLGFPYLILGTFSGMLKKIPKSGVWLVWVERIFGVVLLGAAFFYISLAVIPNYTVYLIPITLVLGGVYLGFIDRSGKEKKVLQRVQWAFGVLTVALGLYFGNVLREPGLTWEPYSAERVAQARSAKQAVMIDFYADWCIPCLELDRKTFTDERVIDAAKSIVRLKVDLTHFDSPEAEKIRKEYSIAGVPTVVFLDESGREVETSRVIGYIPPGEFVQRLQPVISLR